MTQGIYPKHSISYHRDTYTFMFIDVYSVIQRLKELEGGRAHGVFLEYCRGSEQLLFPAQSSRYALGDFFFLPAHRRREQRGDFTSQAWKAHISLLTSSGEAGYVPLLGTWLLHDWKERVPMGRAGELFMVPLYDIGSSLCMCACLHSAPTYDSEDNSIGLLFSCHLLGSRGQTQVARPSIPVDPSCWP